MKKENKSALWMILYWALYLTATMSLFERLGIDPHTVPGGFLGWMIIVEVPRVALGWGISLLFFKYGKGGKK